MKNVSVTLGTKIKNGSVTLGREMENVLSELGARIKPNGKHILATGFFSGGLCILGVHLYELLTASKSSEFEEIGTSIYVAWAIAALAKVIKFQSISESRTLTKISDCVMVIIPAYILKKLNSSTADFYATASFSVAAVIDEEPIQGEQIFTLLQALQTLFVAFSYSLYEKSPVYTWGGVTFLVILNIVNKSLKEWLRDTQHAESLMNLTLQPQ